MTPKILILIQARMGSSRLPGKLLKKILDRPVISFLIERLRRVKTSHELVVATTNNPLDDAIVDYCKANGLSFFRGSEEDVLERFALAAEAYPAEVIVRITADCPLIDPELIDKVLRFYLENPSFDFVSTALEKTYPRGMDVEIFSSRLLQIAHREAMMPDEREHVTPFFYRHDERFVLVSVVHPTDESAYRWTLDTEEDLRLLTVMLETIYPVNPTFTLQDLLHSALEHPEWKKINEQVLQKGIEETASSSFGLECVRASEVHAKIIFDWRNDPKTQEVSFHTKPKIWESFYREFRQDYFVFPDLPPFFVTEHGIRVAFLRLEPVPHPTDSSRKCCEVSINVSPPFRGRGVGHQSLLLAKEFARKQGYDDLYAEVKFGNIPSKKAFEHAGFLQLTDKHRSVFDINEEFGIYRYLAKLSIRSSYARKKVLIIAEAGSNWVIGKNSPDKNLAKKLIYTAAAAGADIVKFQVFQPETIYVPNPGQSQYLAKSGIHENVANLFQHLVMPKEWIAELAETAKDAGILFMATPFSPEDFKAVDPYVSIHKIASYEIGHIHLLQLAGASGKPLIMSTGAATEDEIVWAVDTFKKAGGTSLTLLQCTAQYPADPEALNLRALSWLKNRFHADVGLSDHSVDPIAAPLAAVALGASVIEKHFTLDKSYSGPDHAFALNPIELAQMVKAIRSVEPMLGCGMKYVHASEEELRTFCRRGIQAIKDIQEGDIFEENVNIAILRPGNQPIGVHPLFMTDVISREAKRTIPLGSGIVKGDY